MNLKILSLFIAIAFCFSVKAQTPGMIIEPATGAGTAILDPNGDGYVSATNSGFVTDDQLESEIPFTSLIFPGNEPTSDLNNAPNCGFTDFVDQGDRDPAQKFYSLAGNWLFRFRMGSVAPNAKSYSILIDTDGKFGNTGPNADPDYTLNNPGFEIELVLATKFGVFVYNVNTPSCSPVLSYPGTTNYQKSIALTTNCNDPDYFLDFFVPFSALQAQFGVTPSTPMRYVIVDNTAANKSTICNPNSASDVGGVGNCPNLATCFTNIINYQGMCAPNQSVCTVRSDCPVITGAVASGASSLSGTSAEANGTVIKLYKNTVFTASTTLSAGNWTISGLNPVLTGADIIYVSATAPGEYESLDNCNAQTITACPGTVAPSPTITNATGKNFCGTGTPGLDINVYRPDNSLFIANPITSAYLPVPVGGSWVWKCTGNTGACNSGSGVDCIPEGGYMLFQVNGSGCKSYPAFECVSIGGGYSPVNSITPTITANTASAGATAVQINVTLNSAPSPTAGYVHLFVNGLHYAVSALITSSGMQTVACPALPSCSTLTARFVQGLAGAGDHDCFSNESNSVTITGGVTTAPVISGPFCTAVSLTSISGISSEANGTQIQLYENGTAEGSVATVTNGAWTASVGVSVAPGSTLYATALAPCKTISANSSTVLVGTQSNAGATSVTTTPIFEQGTTLSGAGTNGSIINLYIDGSPLSQTTTVSGGFWTVSGLANYELYPGGVVSAAAQVGNGCPSSTVNGGTVVCIPPATSLTVNPATINICSTTGTAGVSVVNSQTATIYQLFLANGTTSTGASVLGNGNTISLNSGTLNTNTTLRVKAIKPGSTCTGFQTDDVPVIFTVPNTTLSITANTNVICAGQMATLTLANSQNGFVYQLRDNANNSTIGSSVNGTGSSITFTTGALSANTSFNILTTGPAPGSCTAVLASVVSISVSAIPTLSITNTTNTTVLTCTTPSIVLNASGANAYAWSGGLGAQAGATVTTPNTYTVTGTNAFGCSATSTITITQNTTVPNAGITNNSGTATLTCNQLSISLTASGGNAYTWSGGLGNAANATATTSGNYTVTVTGSNGCTASASIAISQNTTAPIAGITNNSGTATLTCNQASIALTATGGASYLWNNGLGSSANATVTLAGVYVVTVTAVNGCKSSATLSISQNTTAPIAGITNNSGSAVLNCTLNTISLTANGGSAYAWSGNLGNTANATATASGNYTVTVTGSNGCLASASIAITQNTTTPNAGITNNSGSSVLNCTLNTISLTATGGNVYAWSGGLGNTANANVSNPANITVTVTASNGCTATSNIGITQNTTVPNAGITNNSGTATLTCNQLSISLTASGGNAYTWSGGLGNAANATATTSGNYTVTVTGSNGCTASASIAISQNTTAPIAGITNNSGTATLTCNQASIALTATGGASYLWNNGLGSSANATVTLAGVYVVTVTAVNGCKSSATLSISQNTTAPIAGITNNSGTSLLTCAQTSISLSGTGGSSYLWSNGLGSSTTVIVSGQGLYTLTAFASNGCSATATIQITQSAGVPTVILTNNTGSVQLTCNTPSISLSISGGTSYVWSGGLPPASNVTITAQGQYTATVTGTSGCTSSTVISISQNTTAPTLTIINTTGSSVLNCTLNSIMLNVSGANTYTWSGGLGSNSVITTSSASTLSVLGTGTNGCASPASTIAITQNTTAPLFTISPQNNSYTLSCLVNSISVSASGPHSYTWMPGLGNASTAIVSNAGTYSVTATGSNGCQSSQSFTVIQNLTVPAMSLTALPSAVCAGSSVTLTAAGVTNYTWLPVSFTGSQISQTQNTSVTYTVQGAYGTCTTSATLVVPLNSCPTAINDATAGIQNTPLTGNISTNDISVAGGTYNIAAPMSPSIGSVSYNASTGQFTFTPDPNFTGTLSLNYTVCNGNPVVCSNALISLTVFPTLLANTDNIITAPSLSVTNSLSTNDNGIVAYGTYIFSVTALNPSVGVILSNTATGQYTFIPNAAFSGTSITTYTLCNTSINPIVCSSASINILVSAAPIALNDYTTTVSSASVVSTASVNDNGNIAALNPTYVVSPTAANEGTITITASTGEFTFVPNPSFNGTVSTTYTLSNSSSTSIATATIFITVFPDVLAVNDVISTSVNTPKSGTITLNDNGIVNGGSYSVQVTPISAASGTLNVTPSGDFTYSPAPGYTGSTTTTYTLTNVSVLPPVSSTAEIAILITKPQIAAAKRHLQTVLQADGNYLSRFVFTLKNIGTEPAKNVQLIDDLKLTFPVPCTFTVNPLQAQQPLNVNSAYNGSTTIGLLSGTDVLAVQQSATVVLNVMYSLNNYTTGIFKNSALASSSATLNLNGSGPDITSSDTTDSGTEVDADLDGNPNENGENDPTPFGQNIALLKAASPLQKINNSTYRVDFTFKIKNLGPLPATNVQVVDDLKSAFPSPATFTVIETLASGNIRKSNAYNGLSHTALLTGDSSLSAGETASISIKVHFNCNGLSQRLFNYGIVSTSANSDSLGTNTHIATDTSDAGTDFDPDQDGNPNENGENDPTGFGSQIGLAKSVVDSKNLGNGITQITFEFNLHNLGIHPLSNPNVDDKLDLCFNAPATYTFDALNSIGVPKINTLYNGKDIIRMLATNQTLAVGGVYTWSLTFRFSTNGAAQSYKNSAWAWVKDSLEILICQDSSNAGQNPDVDGDGNADEFSENDPTPFTPISDGPITPELEIPNAFTPNNDGTNDVFEIKGIEYYPDNHFEILNRWGNLVYKMHGYQNTWDGSSNQGIRFNEGDKLPEGTYFYILKLAPNTNQFFKGYIYLNRK
ncbi:MAG: gliding motility-associated C-terminal domain-containing protein [Bacteroidia bacterium]